MKELKYLSILLLGLMIIILALRSYDLNVEKISWYVFDIFELTWFWVIYFSYNQNKN